jgi:DNA (cytosine-5)-methyltransferase 1
MARVIVDKASVRNIMRKKHIETQTELARMMGITKNQLSVILSDRFNPLKSSIVLLCDTLGVPMDAILKTEEVVGATRSAQEVGLVRTLDSSSASRVRPVPAPDRSSTPSPHPYTVLELFAGAGGLALGLEQAGLKAVGLVEIDKTACATLRVNHPDWNVVCEDIATVVSRGIRHYIGDTNVDILSGGYPCQSFSYAGKKLGLADVRGTMFYYYAELLRQLKPKLFLAENVRGLLSHDGGRTLATMMDVFRQVGYYVDAKVLSALDYGVAQKRQRIAIVGVREDLVDRATFTFPEPLGHRLTLRDVLDDVPVSPGAQYPPVKKAVMDLVPPGGCWRDLPPDIAKSYMGKSYYSGGGRTGMARRLAWTEPSLTLTCNPAQKQTERCHPDETRPLTVREYARIQSFPDSWQFKGSLADQYKQIGNAVPVEFAKMLGIALTQSLDSISRLNDRQASGYRLSHRELPSDLREATDHSSRCLRTTPERDPPVSG